MNIKSTLITIALSATMLLGMAMAKGDDHNKTPLSYTGPADLSLIADLGKNKSFFKDEDVIMEGYIIRQINKDEFIFTDGKDEIQIELEDDVQWAQSLNEKTKVRIFGEYEGGKTLEIEVEHLQVL